MKNNLLSKAEQKFEQGQLHEALKICTKACRQNSKMPTAWRLLGLINGQLSNLNETVKCFEKVIALRPKSAEGYFNLAKTQAMLQHRKQAEQNYQHAIKLDPSFAQAYNNLGTLQVSLNKTSEAETNLKHAIEIQPNNPSPHRNLGVLMQHLGRWEEAETHLRRALKLQPDNTTLLIQLGKILYLQNSFQEAEKCYVRALSLGPDSAETHIDLSAVLNKMGALDRALTHYQKAIALAPDNIRAYNNMAITLCNAGAHQDAVNAAKKALSINPDTPEAYLNLANALQQLGNLEEAADALKQALHYQPDDAEAHSNLAIVLNLQGKSEDSFKSFQRAIELQPNLHGAHNALLVSMNYNLQHSREEIFQAHINWGNTHEKSSIHHTTQNNTIDPNRRIRIGYVSPDFRSHPVSTFFEPILANHDPDCFETYCYSDVKNPDKTTQQLQKFSSHWRHCYGLTDQNVEQMILDDQIDILVDLAGHTADNRLTMFATQPAPIQASYLGYPNTTGLKSVQYLITDHHCDPAPEMDSYYTEKLCRLPDAFFCYQPPANSPSITPAPVIKNGYITFASYNNLAKTGEEVIKLWSDVLKAVPESRLLFQCLSLNDPPTRARYEQLFTSHDIELNRIDFTASTGFDAYLAGHAEVDIIIDTFPWNGHTVSCHGLWMGVPVITLAGDRHASRMGASILTNLGLDDYIAHSPSEFITTASKLAQDTQKLTQLREELRPRMQASNLCDGKKFTHQLEEQYRTMWKQWCSSNS